MAKNTSVMGIYPDRTTVSDAISVLHKAGYRATDISFLSSDNQGSKDSRLPPPKPPPPRPSAVTSTRGTSRKSRSASRARLAGCGKSKSRRDAELSRQFS
jgi:hypothetical protein